MASHGQAATRIVELMTDLFALGDRRLDWLATRQSTVAENVANANTPGYRPRDLRSFEEALAAPPTRLATTNPAHMTSGARDDSGGVRRVDARGWETTVSGNAVAIEQELMRAAETTRAAAVTTTALRSFHRMTLSNVRS